MIYTPSQRLLKSCSEISTLQEGPSEHLSADLFGSLRCRVQGRPFTLDREDPGRHCIHSLFHRRAHASLQYCSVYHVEFMSIDIDLACMSAAHAKGPAMLRKPMHRLAAFRADSKAQATFMIDGAIEKPSAILDRSTAPMVMSVGLMSSPTLPSTAPVAPNTNPCG